MSLSRSALVWIMLTALLGILGQWSGVPSRLWCVPATVLLLALTYESVVVRHWRVHVQLGEYARWPLGREYPCVFMFNQDARAHMTVEVALSAPEEFAAETRLGVLLLPRGRDCPLTLQAKPRRLGRHRWPTPQVRLLGRLRLAWWTHEPVLDGSVTTVIPDMLTSRERVAGDVYGSGAVTVHGGGAAAEVLQLREYRQGDPRRIIDWKASARRSRLISRDLAEERRLEVLIALDVGRTSALAAGDVDRLGLYTNVAARLAQRAAAFDDAVGLLVFAEHPLTLLPPARGAMALAQLRAALGKCTVSGAQSNPALAAARIRAVSPRRVLVVMLTDILDVAPEELAEAVRVLAPKHFAFVCGLRDPAIASLPATAAKDALDPFRALAATEYYCTVERNVRTLRALGAAALAARPEQLDRAVLKAYERFRRQRRI